MTGAFIGFLADLRCLVGHLGRPMLFQVHDLSLPWSYKQDWGQFLGDVPAATAILDRLLAHAEIIQLQGKSYRLRQRARRSEATQGERSVVRIIGDLWMRDLVRPDGRTTCLPPHTNQLS